jgi:hypothetical protein
MERCWGFEKPGVNGDPGDTLPDLVQNTFTGHGHDDSLMLSGKG